MLIAAFIFLPVVIVLVVSRILGGLLLSSGSRARLATFAAICLVIYVVLLVLIARVHE
jgi:hypothetical protein